MRGAWHTAWGRSVPSPHWRELDGTLVLALFGEGTAGSGLGILSSQEIGIPGCHTAQL